jgi:hypothetical protein
MTSERIHSVWDFYDIPREGIADFQGRPHIYKCQFSEVDDDWTNLFWLMEVDRELFVLDLERAAIFSRWREEFKRGNVPGYPALPADQARLAELDDALKNRLHLDPDLSTIMRGRFVANPETGDLEVEWTEP